MWSSNLVGLLFHSFERHLFGFALRLPFPVAEQRCVILHDVLLGGYTELLCGLVDPARRAFDLAKIADRSFVDYDLTLSIRPLGAEFLVTKRWSVSESAQNRIRLLPVFYAGFQFFAAAVTFRLFSDLSSASILIRTGAGARVACVCAASLRANRKEY